GKRRRAADPAGGGERKLKQGTWGGGGEPAERRGENGRPRRCSFARLQIRHQDHSRSHPARARRVGRPCIRVRRYLLQNRDSHDSRPPARNRPLSSQLSTVATSSTALARSCRGCRAVAPYRSEKIST